MWFICYSADTEIWFFLPFSFFHFCYPFSFSQHYYSKYSRNFFVTEHDSANNATLRRVISSSTLLRVHNATRDSARMARFVVALASSRVRHYAVSWKRFAPTKRRCWRDLRNTTARTQVRRHIIARVTQYICHVNGNAGTVVAYCPGMICRSSLLSP